MQRSEFTHDGLAVACDDAGAGPAILMLHNGGTSSAIWREQVRSLRGSGHRVVTIDLPGFGASPRPAQPPSLDDLIGLTVALIKERELAPVLIVGNCMGSNIAAGVARSDQALVRGILAVNPLTAASFGAGRIGFLHRMAAVAEGPTRAARRFSRRIRVPRLLASTVLRFQLGSAGVARGLHHDPDLIACQLRPDQLPALIDVLDDMTAYGTIDSHDIPAGTPLWIAWGQQNRVLNHARSGHLSQRLHAERTEVLERCGHLAMLERPEAVTELIEQLLARTADAAGHTSTSTTTGAVR